MKKLALPIFCGIFIIVNAGCDNRASKGIVGGVQMSYEEIQKRAEAFVPSIGKPGGEIVLSTFSDPKSFNPITATETSTSIYTGLMYEGLLTRNGVTLEMEPNIAERWETSEDGLTWTFFIRPGVEWSDGVPLSAYDVEFTFNELIYNRDVVPNSARDIFTLSGKRIEVKALDSSSVRFVLPVPFAPFLSSMSQEILPKHRHSEAVKRKTFPTSLSIRTPPSEMVANGPWLLDNYISSQRVVFRRNPRYWKKDAEGNPLPYLDRLIFTIVADQNAQLLKFLQGETDYFEAKGEDFPELKRAEANNNFTVYRLGPSKGSSFIVFNQNLKIDPKTGRTYAAPHKLEWFRNDNFRIAIAHVIDKENMVRIAMNGLGYPQWSPKTPAEGFFYNPDVVKYHYDPQKAREILAAEGFSVPAPGSGEFLTDKNGNVVEFSLVTNSGNNVRIKIAEIIRKDLQDLGIRVHFQILEFNSIIQKLDNPPFDWDCILLGLTGGEEPHFGRNVWHSSGTLHMWYPRQASPSTPWEARIDTIFDLGVKEMDRAKRKELYDEWQVIASQKAPFIYTVLAERIECIWDKFENVNPNMNSGLLHNLEYLYVK